MKIIAEHLKIQEAKHFLDDDEIIKILELENGQYIIEQVTGSGFRSFKRLSQKQFLELKEI